MFNNIIFSLLIVAMVSATDSSEEEIGAASSSKGPALSSKEIKKAQQKDQQKADEEREEGYERKRDEMLPQSEEKLSRLKSEADKYRKAFESSLHLWEETAKNRAIAGVIAGVSPEDLERKLAQTKEEIDEMRQALVLEQEKLRLPKTKKDTIRGMAERGMLFIPSFEEFCEAMKSVGIDRKIGQGDYSDYIKEFKKKNPR